MSEQRPSTETELIEFVRSSDVRAPDELHRTVESLIAARTSGRERPRGSDRSRLRFGLGFAGTMVIAAAVAVALAVGLSSGGSAPKLTLQQASAMALRPATLPAPAESTRNDSQLTVAVDEIAFPYWEDRFGWRATGERTDQVDGRAVTTVIYEDAHGRRIGYAIVADTPAPALSGGGVATRGTIPYRTFSENGAQSISWLRDGHLCVVSGRGVGAATLLKLASWTDDGSVSS
jgi:hypothetical protein